MKQNKALHTFCQRPENKEAEMVQYYYFFFDNAKDNRLTHTHIAGLNQTKEWASSTIISYLNQYILFRDMAYINLSWFNHCI